MSHFSFETWFRGEGVGVAPSRAGGSLHDFGDGMYLTDSPEVARMYAATRAANPREQRVLAVSVDRASIGRVLDLSSDSRWDKFLNDTSDPMLVNRSRKQLIMGHHEKYGHFFEEFLKKYNIKLSSYDAVIGPELVRGGNQMCVLHKNGRPSNLSTRLRHRFKSLSVFKARTQAVGRIVKIGRNAVPFRASSVANKTMRVVTAQQARGSRAHGAAKGVGSILVTLASMYLMDKINGKMMKIAFEGEMDRIAPDIEVRLAERMLDAANLHATGYTPYCKLTMHVEWVSMSDSPVKPGGSSSVPMPTITWYDVQLTGMPVNSQTTFPRKAGAIERAAGMHVSVEQSVTSSEVKLQQDYQGAYTALLHELDELRAVKNGEWAAYVDYSVVYRELVADLNQEREHLIALAADIFGLSVARVSNHFAAIGL